MSSIHKLELQRSFTPYPDKILPVGFRYPQGYLDHASSMNYPKHLQWWFINYDVHGPVEWEFRLYAKNNGWDVLADIDPIPFARDGDFAAFFDGNDRTGDPRVVVVDLGNKVYGHEYANFDVWLDYALKNAGMK